MRSAHVQSFGSDSFDEKAVFPAGMTRDNNLGLNISLYMA